MGIFNFFKKKTNSHPSALIANKPSIMQSLIKSSPHNSSLTDEDPSGIGEFGIVKTNPIPVNGVDNIEFYLSLLKIDGIETTSLRTSDEDNSKVGSNKPTSSGIAAATHASNINGHIDVYNIYSAENKKVAKIYINAYSLRTSKKFPKNFDN